MVRDSFTAALMAAVLLMLLMSPALIMLLMSPADANTYDQESRRMFVEWKAKMGKTYKYAGEEECRYAVFKNTRRRVARANAAGATTSGLNGLSDLVSREEIKRGRGVQIGERSYEEETRRMFVGWKAKYGRTYRDVGEEECRYMLFKANRRYIVKLNAAAATGETAYGLNHFGDLTNEEVRESCDGQMEGKLSARCQAIVVAAVPYFAYESLIQSQACECIASELKETTESGVSGIPADEEAHMWI